MTHSDPRDIAIVVDELPVEGFQVKTQDVVVDFVRELIEPAKGIDLVAATVCHRSVDEACRLLASGLPDPWLLAIR